jgi:hypothetical protein
MAGRWLAGLFPGSRASLRVLYLRLALIVEMRRREI